MKGKSSWNHQSEQEAKVHLTHCNQGEYKGTCKYGDLDCPALRDYNDVIRNHRGEILCGWAERGRFFYKFIVMTEFPKGISTGSSPLEEAHFPNNIYPTKTRRRASHWARLARKTGKTEFRNCERCPVRFYCYTTKGEIG